MRAFGSVGFLVTVLDSYLRRDENGVGGSNMGLLLFCSAAIILLTTVTVFFIPNQEVIREKAEPGSWRRLFADSRFIRFFIYVFLANFMLDGPMFMFGIFVKSVAPNDLVGTLKWLWLIMLYRRS